MVKKDEIIINIRINMRSPVEVCEQPNFQWPALGHHAEDAPRQGSIILQSAIRPIRNNKIISESKLTWVNATSPVPLRVMTSHFSGVVTIIDVCIISALLSCISPVSSFTCKPSGANLWCRSQSNKEWNQLWKTSIPFAEILDHLGCKCFHRCDIHYFECVTLYNSHLNML